METAQAAARHGAKFARPVDRALVGSQRWKARPGCAQGVSVIILNGTANPFFFLVFATSEHLSANPPHCGSRAEVADWDRGSCRACWWIALRGGGGPGVQFGAGA